MDKSETISVLKELYEISGFRISLHGEDYKEIAAYPEEHISFCRAVQKHPENLCACKACDREMCELASSNRDTVIRKCRYGLIEAVSPLYNFGILSGFLMMGQILSDNDGHLVKANLIQTFGEAAADIPTVKHEMINSYVKIMTICAKYLTLSNAMPTEKRSVAMLAREYIHENYKRKITITDICNDICCSKTSLLSSFKSEFGSTVNAYLNETRLNEAAKMLRHASGSVAEIAALTGFSNQSYFSKVFSAKYGVPPTEYMKKETQK